MKTRISAGLVVLALAMLSVAAVALAANSSGKLTKFSYDSAKKVGHLTVTGKHKRTFKVTSSTNCGVHKGYSGDQIPCKSLGKPKYAGKHVRVTWKQVGKARVASLVVVDL